MASTCYDPTDIITIRVKSENESKTFIMPRKLLAWHSAYFAAALETNHGFQENQATNIEIEDNITMFEIFCCWAFTGRVSDPPDNSPSVDQNNSFNIENILDASDVCNLWIFGDMRGIPGLKNAAIDLLHEETARTWEFHHRVIKYVYENTTEASHLRKFWVDFLTRCIRLEDFLTMPKQNFTVDFLFDVLPVFLDRARNRLASFLWMEWTMKNRCQWHDHSGPGGKLRGQSRR